MEISKEYSDMLEVHLVHGLCYPKQVSRRGPLRVWTSKREGSSPCLGFELNCKVYSTVEYLETIVCPNGVDILLNWVIPRDSGLHRAT
jgi:hypothetical protein